MRPTKSSRTLTHEERCRKRNPKKAEAPAEAQGEVVSVCKASGASKSIVWVVLNDAFKPVGTFDYSQKEAAEARAAELTAKGKGTHFVQRTKEAMPEDAPGIGAAIPRVAAPAPKASRAKAAAVEAPIEDEEEIEEEDEEVEVEEADDDDE